MCLYLFVLVYIAWSVTLLTYYYHVCTVQCTKIIYLFAFDLHIRSMLIIKFMVIHVESCRAHRVCVFFLLLLSTHLFLYVVNFKLKKNIYKQIQDTEHANTRSIEAEAFVKNKFICVNIARRELRAIEIIKYD